MRLIVSIWLVRPFGLMRDYLAWMRAQPRLRAGPMARRAVATLRAGVHELRDALIGRNTVADHEHVVRAPGGETFDVIAIYTFRDGLIARVDFAK